MSHCIYVAAVAGLFKIGRTGNLKGRLAQYAALGGSLPELLARFHVGNEREAVAMERHALRLMRWWRKRGEWFNRTEWSRRLIVDWVLEGRIFCPKWLYWIDLETREPLPDWEQRADPS